MGDVLAKASRRSWKGVRKGKWERGEYEPESLYTGSNLSESIQMLSLNTKLRIIFSSRTFAKQVGGSRSDPSP